MFESHKRHHKLTDCSGPVVSAHWCARSVVRLDEFSPDLTTTALSVAHSQYQDLRQSACLFAIFRFFLVSFTLIAGDMMVFADMMDIAAAAMVEPDFN